ncbi:MAG: restriction endonuclease [Sulfurospirillaceae bacterium]|nr:restriction endonuclease [Sulfurospirillaceae bacterium]MCK9545920.1 restriction endonuclease [Sulfurospirillaceae bacterium]
MNKIIILIMILSAILLYLSNKLAIKTRLAKGSKNKFALAYEKFICDLYRKKGFSVDHIGVTRDRFGNERLNRKDRGIDIIARKDGYRTVLIQCKYWTSIFHKNKEDKNFFIDHKNIQEFLGNCTKFLLRNSDIANIDNYEFTMVVPHLHNLKPSALMELKDVGQKVKLELVEMFEKNSSQTMKEYELIVGIIEAKTRCWKRECKKNTTVIALYFYNNYGSIKTENSKISFELKELPIDILKLIQQKYPSYEHTLRQKDGISYIANNCTHCGVVQHDSFLFDKPNGVFATAANLQQTSFIALNKNRNKLEYISKFHE